MAKSKSKTFQKGGEFHEAMDWLSQNMETNDYTPEGTEWSGGEPGPHDPVCELKHKYIVTIWKVEEGDANG